MHVIQKRRLGMKMRLIISFQWLQLVGEYFEKTKISSCDCCALKKFLDKADNPNFAKSLILKY